MQGRSHSVQQLEPPSQEPFVVLQPAPDNLLPLLRGLLRGALPPGNQGEAPDPEPVVPTQNMANPQPGNDHADAADAGAEAQPPANAPANPGPEEGQ